MVVSIPCIRKPSGIEFRVELKRRANGIAEVKRRLVHAVTVRPSSTLGVISQGLRVVGSHLMELKGSLVRCHQLHVTYPKSLCQLI